MNRNVVGARTSVLCIESWCSTDTAPWWPRCPHEWSDLCRRCRGTCARVCSRCAFCWSMAAGGIRCTETQEVMPTRYARVSQGCENPVCQDDAGVHAQQLIPRHSTPTRVGYTELI